MIILYLCSVLKGTRETTQTHLFINPKSKNTMAFPYAPVLKKNPKTKLMEVRAIASTTKLNVRDLYKKVAAKTTLTSTDVAGCIETFLNEVTEGIREGRLMKLGDFGSFYPTLSSEAAKKEDSFSPAMINKVRVRFRPGTELKEGVNSDLTFVKTITKKEQAAAKKSATEAQNSALHAQSVQAGDDGE